VVRDQTPPPHTAIPLGLAPTVIVCRTDRERGSTRETVPEVAFAAQTAPWPIATDVGACSTDT
jgi:hypothetical protein